MFCKDSIESTYCFFHQKWRVYAHSTIPSQKDDIEYAISSYVQDMDKALYSHIAHGKEDFLCEHLTFASDMQSALHDLENMM